jgi:arylsulfatase A-like enzyme
MRPTFCWFLILLTATGFVAAASNKLPAQRPNILLIVADDMGYGDLGCYGSEQIPTPNLDGLAAGGIRFTDAYVAASVCAPSRAGFLTGRYPQRFGFEHNLSTPANVKPETVGIPLDEVLISQRLQALGYRTGIIGKWHVGAHLEEHRPNARGFDFFFGMLGGSHTYWPTLNKNQLQRNGQPVDEIRTPYLTDWFSLEAQDFIKRNRQQPWFLFLSYNTPHTPMQAKEEDLAKFRHIAPQRRQRYCAMQHCMDQNIGSILQQLKDTHQFDNTLIVFISDNGGSVTASSAINAPLNGMKGTFLEGGLRVPMVMHWPAGLEPGQTYRQPVISLDFTPTFVELAGDEIQQEVIGQGKQQYRRIHDGVSLLPYLRGEKDGPPHETLYWRIALRGSAIRHHQWKLIQTPHHPTMLFDYRRTSPSNTIWPMRCLIKSWN